MSAPNPASSTPATTSSSSNEAPPSQTTETSEQKPLLTRAARYVSGISFVGFVLFCWLLGGSWLVGYFCWLVGSKDCAYRVASPVRFVLQNPPSVGLVTLVLAALTALLFFIPLSDFLHNLESVGGVKRQRRRGRRTQRGSSDGE